MALQRSLSTLVQAGLTAMCTILLASCGSSLVGAKCQDGASICDGRCVDLQADEDNCGSCGNACSDSQTCVAGQCQLSDGSTGRDSGDSGNTSMSDGSMMSDGSIPDGGPNCNYDQLDCSGFCRDYLSDPNNCGTCGNICLAPNNVCDDGVCVNTCSQTTCGSVCVDTDTNPDHCGACNTPCSGVCVGGNCETSCGLGELSCNEVCVNPQTDPNNCGSCGTVCMAPTDTCQNGVCVNSCTFTTCGLLCVNTDTNPDHCSGCNMPCPSGLCKNAMCVPELGGHVIGIGHDYSGSRNDSMERLIANAVFNAAPADPLEILSYIGTAAIGAQNGTNASITANAAGRTVNFTPASAVQVSALLSTADVFLVYAQSDGTSNADLAALGGLWLSSLSDFLRLGGVFVFTDGPASTHNGTFQIASNLGLFTTSGISNVTMGTNLFITDPANFVAAAVVSPYIAEIPTVRFENVSNTIVVGESFSGATDGIVIHRFVSPP